MKSSRKEYKEIRDKEARNKEYYFRSHGVAAEPHTINLSVNNNCFMRCKMCDIGTSNSTMKGNKKIDDGYFSSQYAKEERYVEFPVDRIKELVDEMVQFSPIIRINFVEPLICKNLYEIALYVKKKGLEFHTITNGWLLRKSADWIVDVETNLLRVSLDGTEEVHDSIRGIKGSFSKAITGIEDIISQKEKLGKFCL